MTPPIVPMAAFVVEIRIPSTEAKTFADGKEHMTYNIVSTLSDGTSWAVSRRFNEFDTLHLQMTAAFSAEVVEKELALPPKQPLGNTIAAFLMSREGTDFIDDRRQKLEAYLTAVVAIPDAVVGLWRPRHVGAHFGHFACPAGGTYM